MDRIEILKELEEYIDCGSDIDVSIAKDIIRVITSQQQEIERLKGDGWISVEDRLPKDYQRVIVVNKGNAMKIVTYRDKYKGTEYWGDSMIELFASPTHWQPLPTEPKED